MAVDGRRLGREIGIALTIMVLGLPLVLLLGESDAGGDASTAAAVAAVPAQGVMQARGTKASELLLVGGPVLGKIGRSVLDELALPGHVVSRGDVGYAVGRPPLGTELSTQLADRAPTAVVVQGGELDGTAPSRTAWVGAVHLIDRVRAAVASSTSITLIGPVPTAAGATSAERRVAEELAAAAKERSVHFLDPAVLGWRVEQTDLAARVAEAVAPFVQPTAG